ncbi:Pentatricopeptide repeat-containing protein [Platanthera guangdongensis]|uniref:Pentatricopeptide repeat-containing protein n=1 Tax=Platanthera guangdongensis TaxID=2320717 RepID=A0ABR2LVR6_9ASPA
MPPATHTSTAGKHCFYYGHRRPSRNRPVVFGGLFTNRKTLPSSTVEGDTLSGSRQSKPRPSTTIHFRDWDPDLPSSSSSSSAPPSLTDSDRRLSPLARFICDSLRRNHRWCPAVLSDLNKLRRVTPDIVSEVLRSRPLLPASIYTRFFRWAGRQKGFSHTFASYNALAYSLSASGLFRAADQIPELMLAHGKSPSEKQLEILIRFHADARRPLRVFHLYQKMRSEFGVSPGRTFLYNRIIDSLVNCGRLDLGLAVYDDLRSDEGLKEDAVTFTIICKGFCRAGRIDELIHLLDRMRSEVCRPDLFAYTAMIKILTAEGNLDGSLRIWDEMAKDGVEADAMAYSTLIVGLSKSGRMEKGEKLFRAMKRKGFLIERSVYCALVEGYVAGGKVESGFQIFKEMVDDGYRADLDIYDSLIRGCCTAGRFDNAFKLFELVISEGIDPEFTTVSPLLVGYADADQIHNFFQFLDRLYVLGLPAMDFLSSFFTVFLERALHKIKEVKKALTLFYELKSSDHLKPDSCTYSLAISCISDIGDADEACSYFNMMKENSWTPAVSAYVSLVRGLCVAGEIDAAMIVVRDCLGNVTGGPMEFKYSLRVVDACCSGEPEKVVEVLNEMVELGYPVEDVIYCAIIHGFCKHASSGEARAVLDVMKDRNILSGANFVLYEDMLNEHLKKVAASLVISGLKFFGLEKKLRWRTSLDDSSS